MEQVCAGSKPLLVFILVTGEAFCFVYLPFFTAFLKELFVSSLDPFDYEPFFSKSVLLPLILLTPK